MNILEAYIKFTGGMFIIISGLYGSNKGIIAKNMAQFFNFTSIRLENFCKKDNKRKFYLAENQSITDWEHVEVFDWDAFNDEIKNTRKNGVIAYGSSFPDDKLKIKPDIHIDIKISKNRLIAKRREYIENNKEKCEEYHQFLNTDNEKKINNITFTYYLNNLKISTIDKIFHVGDESEDTDKLHDEIAVYIFDLIQGKLENIDPDKKVEFESETTNTDSGTETTNTESKSISDTSEKSIEDTSETITDKNSTE